jgi:energy-coupling factor transporter ATP-binding protein EcfA2
MFNVAIVGKMGAGKSSLANHLVDVHKYTRVANAGALKALAAMAYGPIDKGETYRVTVPCSIHDNDSHEEREISGREVLQGIGQIVKQFDRDFWLKAMMRDIETKGNGPFVCDDTRFPFEADFLRERGWIIAKLYVPAEIRAERYERLYGRAPTEQELSHPSETEVDNITEDVGLSGTDPIETLVEQLFEHMDWRERAFTCI